MREERARSNQKCGVPQKQRRRMNRTWARKDHDGVGGRVHDVVYLPDHANNWIASYDGRRPDHHLT